MCLFLNFDIVFSIPVNGSYLANEIYKQPVIIYEYPKEVKPFYVHVKEDGKTASGFDIIAPKVSFRLKIDKFIAGRYHICTLS